MLFFLFSSVNWRTWATYNLKYDKKENKTESYNLLNMRTYSMLLTVQVVSSVMCTHVRCLSVTASLIFIFPGC